MFENVRVIQSCIYASPCARDGLHYVSEWDVIMMRRISSEKDLIAQHHKAVNGLRVGLLSWCLEFTNTLHGKFVFSETADPTVHHRLEQDGSLTLVRVYVDDLIIYSYSPRIAKDLYAKLSKIYNMKQTGTLGLASVGS